MFRIDKTITYYFNCSTSYHFDRVLHINIILDGTPQNTYAKIIMTLDDFIAALINDKYKETTLEDYQQADIRKDLADRLNKFISLNVLTEPNRGRNSSVPRVSA